jgi:cellulose synthase operon protein C
VFWAFNAAVSCRLGAVALCAVSCVRLSAPTEPLAVAVFGAESIRLTDAGRQYVVPEDTSLTLCIDGGVEFVWSESDWLPTDGGPRVDVGPFTVGTHAVRLKRGGGAGTVSVVVRPALPLDAGLDDASLPALLWPTACLRWARSQSPADKPLAYRRCAIGGEARGFVSEGIRRRSAALYWAEKLGHHALSQQLITEAEASLRQLADVPAFEAELRYRQAAWLTTRGLLRQALHQADAASALADEGAAHHEAQLYRAYAAAIASQLGQHAEALSRVAQIEPRPGLSAADLLALHIDVSWVKLRAAAAGVLPLSESLRAELKTVVSEAATANRADEVADALANEAFGALLAGDLPAVETAVRAAHEASTASASVATFLQWLEGQVALRNRRWPDALAAFDAMLRDEPPAEVEWRAHLGRAVSLLQLKRRTDSARALAVARKAISRQAREVQEPVAQTALLGDRRQLIAEAIETLVTAGETREAWKLADEGQAWLARSLEADRSVRLKRLSPAERDAFEKAEERYARHRQLVLQASPPALASQEAFALWQDQQAAAKVALRAEATALAERLDTAASAPTESFEQTMLAADEALVELFASPTGRRAFLVRKHGPIRTGSDATTFFSREALPGVRHLYVAAGGQALALGALPSHLTITFIPTAAWLRQTPSVASEPPLVIGDPRRDLPHALVEAKVVAATVGAEALTGDAATLEAVLARWQGRRLLHFAGHGRLAAAAPWEARLELAGGTALDVELILARRPALGLVVLSGCETGKSHEAPLDGLGLAEAFLFSGARQVIATTEEVDDAAAARFVQKLYALGLTKNPAQAYRQAVVDAEATGDSTWRAFRVFGHRM